MAGIIQKLSFETVILCEMQIDIDVLPLQRKGFAFQDRLRCFLFRNGLVNGFGQRTVMFALGFGDDGIAVNHVGLEACRRRSHSTLPE